MCKLLESKSHIALRVSSPVFRVLEVKHRAVQLLGECSALEPCSVLLTTYISVCVCARAHVCHTVGAHGGQKQGKEFLKNLFLPGGGGARL